MSTVSMKLMYVLLQCSSHEQQVKKGECLLLVTFGKGTSFSKAQE